MEKIDYKKFGFLPYQVAWLEDSSQIKIYEKSRRVGITYVQAFEDVMDCGVYDRYDVWFSSNNETNAREYIDYCKKFAGVLNLIIKTEGGEELLTDADAQSFVVRFRNGRKITGLSSSPNQLHGKGGKMVLDEFARRDNELEVWEAASPAALVWGFPIRIISTHRGKQSLFYSFLKRLDRGELHWSRHRTTFTDAVSQGLADKSLNKKCEEKERSAFIDQIRDSVGDISIWMQQFMCEPIDENETFLSYTLLEPVGRANLLTLDELQKCRELYAGLDVGRKTNFSLFWIVEKINSSTFETRYIYPIQGVDFPRQEKLLTNIIAQLPHLRRTCIDSTGMGIGLTDYLQRTFGKSRIEAVNFTAAVKEVMAFRLKKAIEDVAFFIPADTKIYDDFALIKKSVTASGNIRLQAGTKNDSHADYFWGAALALEAAVASPYITPKVHVPNAFKRVKNDILKGFKRDFK
ncbi:MAG: terminase family protein [Rikenellaceae bacterium]